MKVTNEKHSKILKKGKCPDKIAMSSKTRRLTVKAIMDRYRHVFLHLRR